MWEEIFFHRRHMLSFYSRLRSRAVRQTQGSLAHEGMLGKRSSPIAVASPERSCETKTRISKEGNKLRQETAEETQIVVIVWNWQDGVEHPAGPGSCHNVKGWAFLDLENCSCVKNQIFGAIFVWGSYYISKSSSWWWSTVTATLKLSENLTCFPSQV